MELFSCHGPPETIVSDNDPQFASAEFKAFTAQHDIVHTVLGVMGQAENAVKIVKRVRESGRSEQLNVNTTPAEGVGLSPAQRLFGQRCRTSLPTSRCNIRLRHSTEHESRAMRKRKQKQANYYNRSTRPLSELSPEDFVSWGQDLVKGDVREQVAPRSYDVSVDGTTSTGDSCWIHVETRNMQ